MEFLLLRSVFLALYPMLGLDADTLELPDITLALYFSANSGV